MNLFDFACENFRLQAAQVQQEPAAEIPPFILYGNKKEAVAGEAAEIVSEGRAHVNIRPNFKE